MIVFENGGLIDLDAVRLMGVSVKAEDAIGYFGTGMKFAVASALREACHVDLWRDGKRHSFTTQQKTVRGQEFHEVLLDGEPLGFTTMLGRNWASWMILREFACNAWDEGGSYTHVREGECMEERSAGRTCFAVSGETIEMAYMNRDQHLIDPDRPRTMLADCEVLPGVTPYLFYKGVRVWKSSKPFKYTYNITSRIQLTEDRTALYHWQLADAIARSYLTCEDKELIRTALITVDGCGEGDLDWSNPGTHARDTWLDVVEELAAQGNPPRGKVAETYYRMRQKADFAAAAEMSAEEKEALEKAITFLRRCGWDVSNVPIVVVASLGPQILGVAKGGKSYIAKRAFAMGDKMLASTILEEWLHVTEGFEDKSRGMQNWLFDNLIQQAARANHAEDQ